MVQAHGLTPLASLSRSSCQNNVSIGLLPAASGQSSTEQNLVAQDVIQQVMQHSTTGHALQQPPFICRAVYLGTADLNDLGYISSESSHVVSSLMQRARDTLTFAQTYAASAWQADDLCLVSWSHHNHCLLQEIGQLGREARQLWRNANSIGDHVLM